MNIYIYGNTENTKIRNTEIRENQEGAERCKGHLRQNATPVSCVLQVLCCVLSAICEMRNAKCNQ